jgi:hypothetical protein
VRVSPRVGGAPVGVEHGHDPEIDAPRRRPLEPLGDRDAGALVSVDAADDEHARPRGIAHLDGTDRTAIQRATEQHHA